MSTCTCVVTTTFLLLFLTVATTISCTQELHAVHMARAAVIQAMNRARTPHVLESLDDEGLIKYHGGGGQALSDCAKLYDVSESRLTHLLDRDSNHTVDDARTWLSGVLENHRTCLDGLREKGFVVKSHEFGAQNLTVLLSEALSLYGKRKTSVRRGQPRTQRPSRTGGILTSWNPTTSKADFLVAQDGSGTHRTINEALVALSRMGNRRPQRVIIYVKSGVYKEKVDIDKHMKNIMFVGDGMDRTTVTGSQNVPDGSTTIGSATFGVSGDGFWARDMTFENTAGPQKHQAVALQVSSDLSVFYRCSFRGYQDTLLLHSLRQFYRDCHIYGTIDFIFGDAVAVLQNCDIFVKRPMDHQANMITAQGRDDPNENTGISIQGSRVRPSSDLSAVKDSFKNYLGRPWKKYSRTVFLKTDLDGIIHPKGWTEWEGNFALSTLFYAEYMNTGVGASTADRVNWPGFHVFNDPQQANPFAVNKFIQGDSWIPVTGVPFWVGI